MTAEHNLDQHCTENYIAAIQHPRRFIVFISLKDHSDPSPAA